MADYPLTAAAIASEIKRAGIHFVVALPDRVTSQHLLKGMLSDGDFHVVQVCKEDEGVSLCSGLYAAGKRSVLMMQYTGLLDSINSIRGIGVEVRQLIVLLDPRRLILVAQAEIDGERVRDLPVVLDVRGEVLL